MILNMNEAFKLQNNLVAFNFFNIETLTGILEAAEELDKAVIVAFGEGYIKYVPLEVIASIVYEYEKIFNIPIVLHLDHASNISVIKKAIDHGFKSIMFDGSRESLEKNIGLTRSIVEYAHSLGVSVEAELGYLNSEDGTDEIEEIIYTSVEDSKVFVKNTNVDALAVAVGNSHGIYKREPNIDMKRIFDISKAINIPLVLHGSSGIENNKLRETFDKGIRKINVNTQIAMSASNSAREYLIKNNTARFEHVMQVSKQTIKDICIDYLKLV